MKANWIHCDTHKPTYKCKKTQNMHIIIAKPIQNPQSEYYSNK